MSARMKVILLIGVVLLAYVYWHNTNSPDTPLVPSPCPGPLCPVPTPVVPVNPHPHHPHHPHRP